MRNSSFVFIVALALIFSLSANGQPDRMIDLPAEPQRSPLTNTLADAARRHDFPTFDTMYRTAVSRQSVAAFDELHSLWTWAMTDPIGAFYGQQRYERYARMFPAYARFIEEYRIVDSNGNSFFPTAETRKFLLEQALSRTPALPAPVIQVAESGRQAIQAAQSGGQEVLPVRERATATPPVPSRKPAPAPVVAAPKPAPTVVREVAVPVVATVAPPQEPIASAEASPYIAPQSTRSTAEASPYTPTRAAVPSDRGGLGRGIFLIIAGLLGVGMLTMMLHTPATPS